MLFSKIELFRDGDFLHGRGERMEFLDRERFQLRHYIFVTERKDRGPSFDSGNIGLDEIPNDK